MGQRVGICVRDPALKRRLPAITPALSSRLLDVPRAAEREGEAIEALRVEGGLYAVHRLIGPYALISPTFRALYGGWLPQSGYARDDRPGLELYRNLMVAGLQHDLRDGPDDSYSQGLNMFRRYCAVFACAAALWCGGGAAPADQAGLACGRGDACLSSRRGSSLAWGENRRRW